MTEEELAARIRRHNVIQIAMGAFLVPASVLLWLLSFWVFRVLFYLALSWADINGLWSIAFWVALGATALLAVEGLRQSRELFDLADFADSPYFDDALRGTRTGRAVAWQFGNPLGGAYLVVQILFLAPAATLQAVVCFRSLVRVEQPTVARAAEIFTRLRQERAWVPVAEYPESGGSVMLLDRLELIHKRSELGEWQIRHRILD